MKANDLRNRYKQFYQERGHQLAAAASLLPQDQSVLYISAGMQPLVPYLMGKAHPQGKRLVNVQPCLRTDDIEEVGDDYHLTLFEMLGNWSLGDYFKKEAITMTLDFLRQEIGIGPKDLAVTIHQGNDQVGPDQEARDIWLSLGLQEDQIFSYGDEENWWGPVGQTGPCGPDSEIFYVNDQDPCSLTCGPACSCGKYVELGNNVFMTYYKNEDGSLRELDQKNIDVGLGLERVLVLKNQARDVYETDLFQGILTRIEDLAGQAYSQETLKAYRVIADHIRASVFILAEDRGIVPSNSDQGYILRRLLRRSIRMLYQLGVKENVLPDLVQVILGDYGTSFSHMTDKKDFIMEQVTKEYDRFARTLVGGLKKANHFLSNLKGDVLSGQEAFKLYDTYGFPLEFTQELAEEGGKTVDLDGFNKAFESHQVKSRQGGQRKFKGGLVEEDEKTIRLHTATHLLQSGLRHVLGQGIEQKGSHITSERLRFDFSYERKLTQEELEAVEGWVNQAIEADVKVTHEEMSIDQARAIGATCLFGDRYEDQVLVYTIPGYSIEVCGGRHADSTGQLGTFKIIKEQSSSAGVRRIKAILIE